jgi:UDP-N-acetylmuramyl pentapeptide phosphotransferase/UDP-N-acetylglucosamine-1-phosphate transferase
MSMLDAGWSLLFFFMLAGLCCWLALQYARRRQLLDQPGERRSHQVATPRGGGAGVVLALLLACAAASLMLPDWRMELLVSGLALVLVGGIGWWDDHRPLPALTRLLVHMIAAALLALLVWRDGGGLGWSLLAFCLTVGLINIWNFMDGINGLAVSQAALVAIFFGFLLPSGLSMLAWLVALACLAFLPFNFPRARIFLGDVGSGALGLLMALLAILVVRRGELREPLLVLWPMSVFLVDAGFTLLVRICRGDRWMQAHTEHLYQWCIKRGAGHTAVTLAYALASIGCGLLAMAQAGAGMSWALIMSAVLWIVLGTVWIWCRSRLIAASQRRINE